MILLLVFPFDAVLAVLGGLAVPYTRYSVLVFPYPGIPVSVSVFPEAEAGGGYGAGC